MGGAVQLQGLRALASSPIKTLDASHYISTCLPAQVGGGTGEDQRKSEMVCFERN